MISNDDDEKIKNKSDSNDEKEKVDIENDSYCIFIKGVNGKTTMIKCSPSHTIAQIKDIIYEKFNIKQNTQRLIYTVKELLDDSRTLEEYGILKDGTIHLTLRLLGGINLIKIKHYIKENFYYNYF